MCFCFPVRSVSHLSSDGRTSWRTHVFWVVRGDAHHSVEWHFDTILVGTVGWMGGRVVG